MHIGISYEKAPVDLSPIYREGNTKEKINPKYKNIISKFFINNNLKNLNKKLVEI